MSRQAQQVWLAVGAVSLVSVVSMTFGMAVGGALVGGALIFLGAVNVIQGRSADAGEASGIIATALGTGKRVRWAIFLIWTCTIITGIGALSLRNLESTFIVTLVDEYGIPVDDAIIEVTLGNDTQTVIPTGGHGKIRYYKPSTSLTAQVSISYRGMQKAVSHTRPNGAEFSDLTVRLFSGREVVGVSHMTVDGMAIDAFLKGDLPPDLANIYPRVRVLRNSVYDTAKELMDIYMPFNGSGLEYEKSEIHQSFVKRVARTEAGPFYDESNASLEEYLGRAGSLRVPEDMTVDFSLDLSADILGYSIDAPLPRGFRLRLLNPDEWYTGDQAMPDAYTQKLLQANAPDIGRTDLGAIAFSLDRLLSGNEIARIAATARSRADLAHSGESARAYLEFMIRNEAPPGLIGATFHIDPNECGGPNVEPHLSLKLPSPELRVTLLKNTGSYPLNIQKIVSTVRSGGQLWRMDQRMAQRIIESEYDILEPGHTVLVPRWIGIRAIYTDKEVNGFLAPDVGISARFHLSPRRDQYTTYDAAYFNRLGLMPDQLAIDLSRVLVGVPASARTYTSKTLAGRRAPGPLYALGSVVDDIEYVVNGVGIQARTDKGVAISMIGTWETGSCPFVFAHRTGSPPLNIGSIIRDRIGPKAAGRDSIRIPYGTERIELRELEREVSYIDAAVLVVVGHGQVRRFPGLQPAIHLEDGRHALIRRGERMWLNFDYKPHIGDEAWLEVSGYYEPGN